jgi:hypothetical protein
MLYKSHTFLLVVLFPLCYRSSNVAYHASRSAGRCITGAQTSEVRLRHMRRRQGQCLVISIPSEGPRGAKRTPKCTSGMSTYSVASEIHTTSSQSLKNFLSATQFHMAVLIPRIRTINVRLSEEEYLELERFCIASGARSISDLVRSTMHSIVASGNQDNSLASSFNQYSAQVKALEMRIKELAAELASFRVGAQPQSVAGPDAKGETEVNQLLADAEISADPAIGKQLPCKTDS